MKTRIIKIDPNFPETFFIRDAAEVLRKGGLVVFPTETVYGIGANFLDKKAVNRLYDIKKRPKDKPFTIHIAGFETLRDLDIELSGDAQRIVHKFWPGPLTVVAFGKDKEKIGVRMPRNKIALELISLSGVPVVAPSANISGQKPPSSGAEVISKMNGLTDLILDAGDSEIGVESSVLDVTESPFKVLREGAIQKKDLLADYHVLFVCTGNSCRSVMAKGMLEKYLEEAGLSEKVIVDSAGTGGYSGILAAPNAIEVMKEEGVDIAAHRGKTITPELLKKADFIFAMEGMHKKAILNISPGSDPKTRLLNGSEDIPDPIGRPIEEYKRIRDMIKDSVENIFLELFNKERKA